MSNSVIKINCKKVYDTSLFYDEKIDELLSIIEEMQQVNDDIGTVWNDDGYDEFYNNYIKHINTIIDVTNFLICKSGRLKTASHRHNNIDENFANQMRKRDDFNV